MGFISSIPIVGPFIGKLLAAVGFKRGPRVEKIPEPPPRKPKHKDSTNPPPPPPARKP